MDSLQNILGTKKFAPPDDMAELKKYIARKYRSRCVITIERNTVVVSVPSATLAAVIHLERRQIVEICGLSKRLVVRTRR